MSWIDRAPGEEPGARRRQKQRKPRKTRKQRKTRKMSNLKEARGSQRKPKKPRKPRQPQKRLGGSLALFGLPWALKALKKLPWLL